jgi:hypothetical protein
MRTLLVASEFVQQRKYPSRMSILRSIYEALVWYKRMTLERWLRIVFRIYCSHGETEMANELPALHTSLLGVDLNLVVPREARTKIVKACVTQWFANGPNGLSNMSDCSGFVKSVQRDLFLRPFCGNANDIFDEISQRPDWVVLGSGSTALPAAGAAADQGSLAIGVWKNPTK